MLSRHLPKHKAPEFQAFYTKNIDSFLTLVAETEIFRIPAQFQSLQVGTEIRNAIHQLQNYNLCYFSNWLMVNEYLITF